MGSGVEPRGDRLPEGGARGDELLSRLLRETEGLSKVGGWRYDVATGAALWTDEVYAIFEVGKDFDIGDVGLSFGFFAPADQPIIAAAFRRCADLGEPFDLELRLVGARGSKKRVRSIARAEREGERTSAMYGSIMDVTERHDIRAALESANARLEGLWSVASLENADFQATCDHILSSIVSMTTSQYGFYGFVGGDETEMNIHSWSGKAMNDCGLVDKPLCYVIKDVGVWGEAVRRREPLVMNDYRASHAAKKGYPPGHVPLTRLLVVPYISRGVIVSVAAVANKDDDYEEADVWQIQAFLAAVHAVLDRRKVETELRDMVARQETLMQELKHRVKNNLNIVSGLLELERPNLDDPEARRIFADTEARIRSIAKIYERLYLSPSLAGVELGEYVGELSRDIMRTFAETRGGVSLALDVERVELETKRTVPLGLMVNELLTNALKYAYPGPAGGEIRVRLARTGDRLRVVVQDDGAGLPERFDPETSGGMGTLLVRMLAAQIGATVSFGATRAAPQGGLGPGTTVAIELAP